MKSAEVDSSFPGTQIGQELSIVQGMSYLCKDFGKYALKEQFTKMKSLSSSTNPDADGKFGEVSSSTKYF